MNTGSFGSAVVGAYNSASGYGSQAFGLSNQALGNGAVAFGFGNYATMSSSAFGNSNHVSGFSFAVGSNIRNTVYGAHEFGVWDYSSNRLGAVRVHSAGTVALTVENRSTKYADGGATNGSEANGTLGRSMFSIRRNGLSFILDYNDAGTVKSITLGTAT